MNNFANRACFRLWISWILSGALIAGISRAAENPTGLAVAPVPSLSYSQGEGWEYGAKLFLYQFGSGSRSPYAWSTLINYTRTTREKSDFYAFVDMPGIRGNGTRLDFRLELKKIPQRNFYGLGNDALFVDENQKTADGQQMPETYNTFSQKWQAFYVNFQWHGPISKSRFLAGIALMHSDIGLYAAPNLLAQAQPPGLQGGASNYVRIGYVLDRRDQEAVPSKGHWTDFLWEVSSPTLGSRYSYQRLTFTDRRYFALHPRLIFAQRILLESMPGHPPFFEMTVISSSYQRQYGLGGATSLRGIPFLLYAGPHKAMANLELRWRAFDLTLLNQTLTFYLHAFEDAGRVWLAHEPLSLADLHASQGVGVHVQWKKDFIGSIDIGRSRFLNRAFYLSFGNLF